MYAVIFKAEANQLDQLYYATAKRMRELAINKYGCIEFISTCEGDNEISISYWESLESIKKWKRDPEHLKAQELGKSIWYKTYNIEITEIIHKYSNST